MSLGKTPVVTLAAAGAKSSLSQREGDEPLPCLQDLCFLLM